MHLERLNKNPNNVEEEGNDDGMVLRDIDAYPEFKNNKVLSAGLLQKSKIITYPSVNDFRRKKYISALEKKKDY